MIKFVIQLCQANGKVLKKKIIEKFVKSLFGIKEIHIEINNLVLFGDTICDTIVPSEST